MDDLDLIPEAMGEGRDDHLPNLTRAIVANEGACISGAAGTGKTKLIEMIVSEIQKEHPGATIITMAFTHRAARIAGGKTISHCLHRYKDVHDAWAIVA